MASGTATSLGDTLCAHGQIFSSSEYKDRCFDVIQVGPRPLGGEILIPHKVPM